MSSLAASTVFNVCLRQVFGLSLQIFYISSAQDVFLFFLTPIIVDVFFPPLMDSCDTSKPHFHHQSWNPSTRFLENAVSKHCEVRSPGEQQLTDRLKVITSDFPENRSGVIYNLLTHCSWLYGEIASTRGKLNSCSSHLLGE